MKLFFQIVNNITIFSKIQNLQESSQLRMNWALRNNIKIPEELLSRSGEYYGLDSRRQI